MLRVQDCGYNTEIIGKWHGGMFQSRYLPQNRGFDHFLGLYGGSGDYTKHTTWYDHQILISQMI